LMKFQQKNGSLGTAKVAVTLPMNFNFAEEVVRTALAETKSEAAPEEEPRSPEPEAIPANEGYFLKKPAVDKVAEKNAQPAPKQAPQPLVNPAFEAVTEAPIPGQYEIEKAGSIKDNPAPKQAMEIHELIAEPKESLNDRLKEEKTELAHVLNGSPVKDLRKAIGINDRYTLMRELFRGDEAMYERSIKTINGFNIYSEAEYWITRELKFKLGWDDNNPNVQHFYQLVRRRFS
jgi:hypothetical protein